MRNRIVRGTAAMRGAFTTRALRAALLSSALTAGAAHAQSAALAPGSVSDSSLTWNGITLYGDIDIGLQYQTHGAPVSDYYPSGNQTLVQKYSNKSVTAVTPSNVSQSRIGLSGNEPLFGDWAGVFRLETSFNPQSGNLVDGLKSLTLNNGKALSAYTASNDSSSAGQLFQISYAGLSSARLGTITFGRQATTLTDGIARYDPTGAVHAFSLLGASGATGGGGGATEDKRLDQTLKYAARFNFLHVGALYQFSGSNGSRDTAIQAQLGAEFGGFSGDLYFAKKYDAITATSLSQPQVEQLAKLCNPPATVPPTAPKCYSVSNSLSGTISDNTTYAAMVLYRLRPVPVTLYGGYQHVTFDNPTNPLPSGSVIIGGYVLAFTTNTAYDDSKVLQVYWGGAKWGITPALDLDVAYYGEKQNAFSTNAKLAGCSTQINSACSGREDTASLLLDWHLSKRFDVYAGTLWSEVRDGLANGFLLTSNNLTSTAAILTTTAGVRFVF